jgi:arginase
LPAHIIQVPYDSGRRSVRMGNGPARILSSAGTELHEASVESVDVDQLPSELGTTLSILRSLSEKVATAKQTGSLPIVLSGGCISSVGILAGLNAPTAVVWLDAHGDFNTPDTTVSGFIDGMSLAMATGRCWRNLTSSIPGFHPVKEKHVVLIGARDIDPEERRLLENSAITRIDTETIRTIGVQRALGQVLANLTPEHIYLHIDLDVLDRSEGCVNEYSSSGGLKLSELEEVVQALARERSIAAAAMTAYDPAYDRDAKAVTAAVSLLKDLQALACINAS